MAFIDYYKILGVPKDIPQKDVRAAYKKRSKQFHPDLHPDDPKAKAKFQALNEAYDVISDPEKRKKYDQFGENWKQADAFGGGGADGFGGFSGGNPFEGFDFSSFSGGGFSSFFQDLFGGMKNGRRHAPFSSGGSPFSGGADTGAPSQMSATVEIDMYKALLGGDVIITLGNGQKLRLKVKPGTQPGTKVRLRGKGYPTGAGTAGDLILTYQVKLPVNLSERQKELLRQMQLSE